MRREKHAVVSSLVTYFHRNEFSLLLKLAGVDFGVFISMPIIDRTAASILFTHWTPGIPLYQSISNLSAFLATLGFLCLYVLIITSRVCFPILTS